LNQESSGNLETLKPKLVQFLNTCDERIKEEQESRALEKKQKKNT
jgi:hypothetical protein